MLLLVALLLGLGAWIVVLFYFRDKQAALKGRDKLIGALFLLPLSDRFRHELNDRKRVLTAREWLGWALFLLFAICAIVFFPGGH